MRQSVLHSLLVSAGVLCGLSATAQEAASLFPCLSEVNTRSLIGTKFRIGGEATNGESRILLYSPKPLGKHGRHAFRALEDAIFSCESDAGGSGHIVWEVTEQGVIPTYFPASRVSTDRQDPDVWVPSISRPEEMIGNWTNWLYCGEDSKRPGFGLTFEATMTELRNQKLMGTTSMPGAAAARVSIAFKDGIAISERYSANGTVENTDVDSIVMIKDGLLTFDDKSGCDAKTLIKRVP